MDRESLIEVFSFLSGFVQGSLAAQECDRFNPEMHFPPHLRNTVRSLMNAAHEIDENCTSEAEKWPRAANIVQFELRKMEKEQKASLLLGDWSWRALIECMQ
jgi:hypothetical protein